MLSVGSGAAYRCICQCSAACSPLLQDSLSCMPCRWRTCMTMTCQVKPVLVQRLQPCDTQQQPPPTSYCVAALSGAARGCQEHDQRARQQCLDHRAPCLCLDAATCTGQTLHQSTAAYLSADMYQAGHPCSLCGLDHISGAGHSSFKKCLPWSAAEAEGQALNGWSSLHPFRSAHRRLCRA